MGNTSLPISITKESLMELLNDILDDNVLIEITGDKLYMQLGSAIPFDGVATGIFVQTNGLHISSFFPYIKGK